MLLPRELSEAGYRAVHRDLADALESAPRRWQIVYDQYPYFGLHISVGGAIHPVALLIEAEDWPHRSISVTPMDVKFSRWLLDREIPQTPDAHGVNHVVFRNGRPWFCVNGTREFHEHYKETLAWESIRHLEQNRPHQIIEACIDCLMLTGPNPGGADS